jgi:glycosyltransferase involved in cell wall biosynthesis
VFPTEYEGSPLLPMEALACGLPIIVFKESNVGEVIEQGIHGFVIKPEMRNSEKVEFILNNPDMIKKCPYSAEI